MSQDRPGQGESIDLYARRRACEAVRAVLSDDHNYERGVASAEAIIGVVLAETGVDALAEVAFDLSLGLASALERIAADGGLAAVDLADVWFVD